MLTKLRDCLEEKGYTVEWVCHKLIYLAAVLVGWFAC